jgi:hypothetical protein
MLHISSDGASTQHAAQAANIDIGVGQRKWYFLMMLKRDLQKESCEAVQLGGHLLLCVPRPDVSGIPTILARITVK